MFCTQCGTQLPDSSKFCHHCGFAVSGAVEVPPPPPVVVPTTRPVEYAGFWRRLVAHIIDRIILGIPSSMLVVAFIVPAIAALCKSECNAEDIPVAIISIIVGSIWLALLIVIGHLLYFTFFESSRLQATPGKMLLGIIVTDLQGQRVTFMRALGRNLGKIISHAILNIGFIMAGFTARKQALHDILADCLVVMK